METVIVHLGNRSYPIFIKKGILNEAGSFISSFGTNNITAIITNDCVGPLYLSGLIESLERSSFQCHTIYIPDGEEHKTLLWMERVYEKLISFELDRTCPIIALGGGVTGDMAGFAAATFMRGVPFFQIPTTLLAQVDSSVGGKTGVNVSSGKNMVGSFYQPKAVFIDTNVLKTLPQRELCAGMAEVVKYGIIRDRDFFSFLQRSLPKAIEIDNSIISSVIKRCCSIKAEITSKDEREETGMRSILNFGHTIAHAIETLTYYKQYRHGEAVSIGMSVISELSAYWGYCTIEESKKVKKLLKDAGLPTILPSFPVTSYIETIQKDKKRAKGNIRLVLLKKIGEVFLEDIPSAKIISGIEKILNG